MRPRTEPTSIHIPVMVSEVLSYLNVRPDGIYLDGTVGLGGHAKYILSHLNPHGRLIGVDRDAKALEICKQNLRAFATPSSLYHQSYDHLSDIFASENITQVDGILLDLGLSSLQLDSHTRGFAFSNGGPLDMRFDSSTSVTAETLIYESSEEELANIIYQYGEERHSRKIARTIKKAPAMSTVDDLVESIRKCTPPQHRNRTLARVFQALRIAVNDELRRLYDFLNQFLEYLSIGGRIVIISYHSLEDRPVKRTFKQLSNENKLNILTKKPLQATDQEISTNSRARSAKFRAAERIE